MMKKAAVFILAVWAIALAAIPFALAASSSGKKPASSSASGPAPSSSRAPTKSSKLKKSELYDAVKVEHIWSVAINQRGSCSGPGASVLTSGTCPVITAHVCVPSAVEAIPDECSDISFLASEEDWKAVEKLLKSKVIPKVAERQQYKIAP